MQNQSPKASFHVSLRQDACLLVSFEGAWEKNVAPLDYSEATALFEQKKIKTLSLDAKAVTTWDSALVIALYTLHALAKKHNISIEEHHIPEGAQRLTKLALAVPKNEEAQKSSAQTGFLYNLGQKALAFPAISHNVLAFVGHMAAAFSRFFRKQSSCRFSDISLHIQQSGAEALPIVSLIALLVGAILAFVGVMQLQLFGATIYVASLVTIGMTRIMGAIMTGIIMAGRTGAAYAATIGTMQANEEVDALETLGINPYDFLVLPRVIALTLMCPLLVIYADFMGILGGAFVAILLMDISPLEYFTYTKDGFIFANVWVGLAHAFVFGMLIALTGCYQGLRCGRNAAAVGFATTKAVVYAIVGIVVSTALLTYFFSILHI